MTQLLAELVVLGVFAGLLLALIGIYAESGAAALASGALLVFSAAGCVLLILLHLSC